MLSLLQCSQLNPCKIKNLWLHSISKVSNDHHHSARKLQKLWCMSLVLNRLICLSFQILLWKFALPKWGNNKIHDSNNQKNGNWNAMTNGIYNFSQQKFSISPGAHFLWRAHHCKFRWISKAFVLNRLKSISQTRFAHIKQFDQSIWLLSSYTNCWNIFIRTLSIQYWPWV